MPRDTAPLTPETLLFGYTIGVFPMAEGRHDAEVHWVNPKRRGILPLDGFAMSRSLARTIRRGRFAVTLDTDFAGVVDGCADREETWINETLSELYDVLHAHGFAHSLEVREPEDGSLVGGIYGVAIGAAFFGESMFSQARDASKVALATLVALLRRQGFTLFDTQFITDHLASMGGIEISREAYHSRLRAALAGGAMLDGPVPQPGEVMHLRSQTS